MRVLAVTNMYPTADRPSYGAFVKSQVESLIEHGHSVNVLFIDGSKSRLAYLRGFKAVRDAINTFQPDVIHAHYGLTGFIAAFPKRTRPLVISFCGDDVLGTPTADGGMTLTSRVGRMLSRFACSRAGAIVVKSEEMRRVVANWGYSNVTVLPNGVDVAFFKPPSRGDRDAARSRLGWAADRAHVLFPHTPYEVRKRVDLARQAVAGLGTAAELHVVYHKPRQELRDYYYAADVMILTSEWEGSPNVVKEAMACDLPTVSFDVGDVRWLAAGTRSHRVVPRHDIAGMIREIQDLVQSGIRDGSERIRRDLANPIIAQNLSVVYDTLLRPGRDSASLTSSP